MVIGRIRAALAAFKDPHLVGESRMYREVADNLGLRMAAAVARPMYERRGKEWVPVLHFHTLTWDQQRGLLL